MTSIDYTSCPSCGHHKMWVIETARINLSGTIMTRRRKRCDSCKGISWTAEIPLELAQDVFAPD